MSTRTIADLAREALNVQDACNLSGVVHSFSRGITDLRRLIPDAGTHDINTHPYCVLFADKVAHLTGTQTLVYDATISAAYDWAHKESGTQDPLEPGVTL